jgi:hypothetical protein
MNIDVDAQEGAFIVLTLTLLGVDSRKAPMTPEVAATVMGQIGQKIEELKPGTLIPGLKRWLTELESMKANGQKVLQELGL